jgi:3-hydroxyacyl-CoA dehydrogenase/enoyl-CoA hydratase/3-hydroxybutyryl-CoA epimerase/enoyl-CoA isomerase
MFKGNALRLTARQDGLVELCFDREGESVNTFDRLAIDEMRQATTLLARASGVRGVLVTSAKSSFIVGADIYQFDELFAGEAEKVEATIREQAAVFDAVAALPVPTVAVINGMAFGGGFELALACDRRILADAATVGLPEVTLGILPGYGGTVRLPRLIGCAAALRRIVSGAPQKAAAALSDGAVDAVLEAERVREAALHWLHQAAGGMHGWPRRRVMLRGAMALDADALAKARVAARGSARHYPAAAAFVQLLAEAGPLEAAAAQTLETRTCARLATSPTAASLVRLFKNDQHLKKRAKTHLKQARPVAQAAVLGAGIMGGGIAYTSALRGVPIVMNDIAEPALAAGMAEVDKLLARQIDARRLSAKRPSRCDGRCVRSWTSTASARSTCWSRPSSRTSASRRGCSPTWKASWASRRSSRRTRRRCRSPRWPRC